MDGEASRRKERSDQIRSALRDTGARFSIDWRLTMLLAEVRTIVLVFMLLPLLLLHWLLLLLLLLPIIGGHDAAGARRAFSQSRQLSFPRRKGIGLEDCSSSRQA